MILTILALSGISTSSTELAMSATTVPAQCGPGPLPAWTAITRLPSAVPTLAGVAPTQVVPTLLPGSTSDRYATATRFHRR